MKQKSTSNSLPNIHEEAERLYFALQASGIGTWTFDPITNEIAVDERCSELFGLEKDKISLEEVIPYIHLDDQVQVQQAIARALDPAQRSLYEIRYRIRSGDGQERWLYCKGKAYFNEANIAYRFSGTAQDVTAVITGREKIAASEQLAQMALEGAKAGFFRIELDTDQIYYSPTLARILTGNETKELSRADFIRRLHPDDRLLRKLAYEKAESTGKLDYEVRVIWTDGSIHWVRVNGSYLTDTSGRHYLYTGTIHDTTDEMLIRKQAENFNLLVAASHDWMGITDRDGRLEFINSAGLALQGLDWDKAVGLSLTDVCTDACADRLRTRVLPALWAGGQWEGRVELRHFKKKKVAIPVYLKIALQQDAKGTTSFVVAAGRDLRGEEAAIQALKENEALFRNVTSSSPTGLWLSDEQGGLTYLNKTLIEWIGMPYKDLLGDGWTFAIIDKDRQRAKDAFLSAVAARTHYDVQFRIKKSDNTVIWCRSAGDPYYREDGSYAGYAGFCMDIQSQVAAAEAFRESEARFRSIIEQAPMAISLLRGRDMMVEVGNKAAFELWGKTPAIVGLPITHALPQIEGQPFLNLLQDVFDTGNPYFGASTLMVLERNGILEDRYFDFAYTPLRDDKGTVSGVMVLATEVTTQVLARKKIEESEARFRSLIAAAPMGIALFMGPERIIQNPNQTFINIVGKGNTITGKPLAEAMPELEGQPFLQILDEVYTTGKMFQTFGTQVNIVRNGIMTHGFYDFSYTPLLDSEGKVYAILDIAIDVTDQVLARQKIADAEEALRGAIELAELATWQLDLADNQLIYSERLRSWFGFSEGESIYNTGYNPVHEKDRARVSEAIRVAICMESGGIYDQEYTTVEYRTGRERIIHAQGRVVLNELGRPVKLTGTAQDVTAHRKIQLALELQVQERTEELQTVNEELHATNEELNEANQQLTHSNEELAQYAYVASHDLQEPLRKIRIFSGLLGTQDSLTEQNRQLVAKINESSERMAMLIRDLLDFSRLLKTDALMRPVDLTAVAQAVVSDFELMIQEKNAEVTIGELPVVEGVGLQMNQLFYNLLSNALKFINPGVRPEISINAQKMELYEVAHYFPRLLPFPTYYRITFTDNGIGFEVKYAEQIFEVFKRLHGRELYPGSGIGLALCRRIVGNHNGHLYADSKPGAGTSFHILIPDRQQDHNSLLPDDFIWDNDQNQQN
jgi:PAS domain S-box-containing protein